MLFDGNILPPRTMSLIRNALVSIFLQYYDAVMRRFRNTLHNIPSENARPQSENNRHIIILLSEIIQRVTTRNQKNNGLRTNDQNSILLEEKNKLEKELDALRIKNAVEKENDEPRKTTSIPQFVAVLEKENDEPIEQINESQKRTADSERKNTIGIKSSSSSKSLSLLEKMNRAKDESNQNPKENPTGKPRSHSVNQKRSDYARIFE